MNLKWIMLNNIYKTLTSSQKKEANIQSQAVWWQQQPIRSELSSDTSPASPISEYNRPKQYWQARPIILYEWCYIQSGTVAIRSRALHSTCGKNAAIFYTNRLAVVLICYFFCLAIWSGEFIPREAKLSCCIWYPVRSWAGITVMTSAQQRRCPYTVGGVL